MKEAESGGRDDRHICLVTHARYPIGEPRAERAAKAARDAGYRVHVVCLRGAGEAATEVVDGVSVCRLPIHHRRGARLGRMVYEYWGFALLASAAALSLHRKHRLTIIQIHTPPDFLVFAGLLPRLFGAKLVLDIRDLSPHLWDARFGDTRSARAVDEMLRVVERLACKVSDTVVTVHEPYRQELARHGVDAAKVEVVMNTPDDRLIAPIADTIERRGGKASFTVAYHGTITSWYGIDILVRAVAEAQGAGLDITASILGEGDALTEVRKLASDVGVADRIAFSGRYVPIEQALRAVAEVDCGVIPNPPSELNRFILSNKLFEYVALGVPVVVARLETISAYFSDDEVTFFKAGDAASLAAALVWVAAHPDETAAKALRAKTRSKAYGWATNKTRYLELLEKVAS